MDTQPPLRAILSSKLGVGTQHAWYSPKEKVKEKKKLVSHSFYHQIFHAGEASPHPNRSNTSLIFFKLAMNYQVELFGCLNFMY